MKQDERGLPLSTDSATAAASFDRSVEHFLKFHADTMVLAGRLKSLLDSPQMLERAGIIAKSLGRPDAIALLADLAEKLAQGKKP